MDVDPLMPGLSDDGDISIIIDMEKWLTSKICTVSHEFFVEIIKDRDMRDTRALRQKLMRKFNIDEEFFAIVVKKCLRYARNLASNYTLHTPFNARGDESSGSDIRSKVHQFWMDGGVPTVNSLLFAVNNDPWLPNYTRPELDILLNSMGFDRIERTADDGIVDTGRVIEVRKKYLQLIGLYREERVPIYYVHDRLMIVGESLIMAAHVGTEDALVPGGLSCLKTSLHGIRHSTGPRFKDFFIKWFENVLRDTRDNAVVVMDAATWHTNSLEEYPTVNWSRSTIVRWLRCKDETIAVTDSMGKGELCEIAARTPPLYDYGNFETLVRRTGRKILWTPPKHGKLNPVEMVLQLANHFAEFKVQSTGPTDRDDTDLVIEGVFKVDGEHWRGLVATARTEENRLRRLDRIIEDYLATYSSPDTDSP